MAGLALAIEAAHAHKLISLIIFALIALGYVITYRVFFHPLSRYPGPFLGKFTDFYSFYGVYKQSRTKLQYEFLQKYGSPVRVSTNELVFSDVKTVSEIYGQSSTIPEKERTISEALSATGEGSLLNTVDRVQHGRIRRLLSHGFSLRSLLDSERIIAEKIELYVELAFRRGAGESAAPRDIYIKTHELFLDIISQLSFDQSFNCLSDAKSTALRDVDSFGRVVPPQAFFPGFRYLPFASIREGFRGVYRLEAFARDCVTRQMQNSKTSPDSDSILTNMFNAQDAESGSKLTMGEIIENTIIFLVAGTSTTAVTLLYLIWECGRRPEIMRRLTEEIRAAFPNPDELPTYAEASKLKYLSNVVDETLRLWGPLNTGIPRISTGRMIAGEYFPAGVGISNNPYATARDPDAFPNPEEYEPDRWNNASTEMRLMSRPFSIGPRNCIGRHLALIGLYVTVTRIFQLFDVTTDPSMTEEKMRQKDQGVFSPWDETLLVRVKLANV
ncbi:uncharacterized protein A1O9_10353 [Exophiala aquamarina CBS 119918]|uniref:Cytochrome P450 n=1 Tax=Exophiala aquamarina CBS 119918 TaxID=1182545 RepID=A0A072P281_9EURO|nr:uncharacterized protein A1O9_10353 [Exophiala aquamarina CBS 119918]KEF53378.1 hypothetical protein A1O9_10353 [Exophiala aquamarina CBS 119918]